METGFEYYAFISYKHEDKKWAKWLQGKLEHYRLPSVIRKEIPRLPKQIRPVFRDDTDLGPGILTDNLRKELEKSQYLIVICSPLSAQSEWVGKEITAFTEMGRADRIIPFIVDGEPNSNDEQECFHPIIKAKIPDMLGININAIGKQQAFVKVAAKLLDLSFDVLWNRFLREQRKQRIIAAVAGLLLLVSGGKVWDYFFRIKVEYYADYVDKKGVPKGIIPLNKAEIKKRNAHYRFESRHNLLRRVVYANSANMPIEHNNTEHADRFAIQLLTYKDKDNRLDETELKNAQGKTIAIYSWSGKNLDRIDIMDMEGGSTTTLAFSFTSLSNLFEQDSYKANIKHFKLTRNEDGFIIRKEFMKNNDDDEEPASDANGISGFEYDLDKNSGRVSELYYFGYANGEYFPLPDKTGVIRRNYTYDEYGNISRTEYFGKNNERVLNEQLWAIGIDVSNSDGNIIETSFFGTNGNPCLDNNGVARWTAKYDKRGNRIEGAYFGTDDNPCLSNGRYAKWKAEYNKHGKMKTIAYFGIDDNPCFNKDGIAKLTAKYDKRGNVENVAYFGIDNNPCLSYDGYAKWAVEYDPHGNIKNASFFGTDGNPRSDKYGVAKWTAEYELGIMIEQAYFGSDGTTPCLHKDNYAKWTAEYERGNMIKQAFFGNDGNPILHKDGYAKWTAEYNERGNMIEQAYFGTDGTTPCLHKDNYAKWTAKYDDSGTITNYKKYGINNQLVSTSTVFLVVQRGDPAYRKRLRGKMIVLKYCDWEFGNTLFELTKKTIPDNLEKATNLVILNAEGQIESYDFGEEHIYLRFTSGEISGERFNDIKKQHNEAFKVQ
jgi:hypothetical protein